MYCGHVVNPLSTVPKSFFTVNGTSHVLPGHTFELLNAFEYMLFPWSATVLVVMVVLVLSMDHSWSRHEYNTAEFPTS